MVKKETVIIQIKGEDLVSSMMKRVSRQTKGLAKGVKSHWAVVSTGINQAMGVAMQAVQVMRQLEEAALEGAAALDLKAALEHKTGRPAGMVLAEFREAVHGTIDDLEILKGINLMEAFGIPAAKSAALMELAFKAATATGQDMRYMLNSVVTAVARKSTRVLDNLGIMLKVEEANQIYAESLGKTADQLTKVEEDVAFLNATLIKGDAAFAHVAGMESHAAAIRRVSTEYDNLILMLKEELAKALVETFDALEKMQEWAILAQGPRGLRHVLDQIATDTWRIGVETQEVIRQYDMLGSRIADIAQKAKYAKAAATDDARLKAEAEWAGGVAFRAAGRAGGDLPEEITRTGDKAERRRRGRGGGRDTAEGPTGPTGPTAIDEAIAEIEESARVLAEVLEEVERAHWDEMGQIHQDHLAQEAEYQKAVEEQAREHAAVMSEIREESLGRAREGIKESFGEIGESAAVFAFAIDAAWDATGPKAANEAKKGMYIFATALMKTIGMQSAVKIAWEIAEAKAAFALKDYVGFATHLAAAAAYGVALGKAISGQHSASSVSIGSGGKGGRAGLSTAASVTPQRDAEGDGAPKTINVYVHNSTFVDGRSGTTADAGLGILHMLDAAEDVHGVQVRSA